jgi:hypothetical protein
MSLGKHLSLEEARKTGQLMRFAKEHPSDAERGPLDVSAGTQLRRADYGAIK